MEISLRLALSLYESVIDDYHGIKTEISIILAGNGMAAVLAGIIFSFLPSESNLTSFLLGTGIVFLLISIGCSVWSFREHSRIRPPYPIPKRDLLKGELGSEEATRKLIDNAEWLIKEMRILRWPLRIAMSTTFSGIGVLLVNLLIILI